MQEVGESAVRLVAWASERGGGILAGAVAWSGSRGEGHTRTNYHVAPSQPVNMKWSGVQGQHQHHSHTIPTLQVAPHSHSRIRIHAQPRTPTLRRHSHKKRLKRSFLLRNQEVSTRMSITQQIRRRGTSLVMRLRNNAHLRHLCLGSAASQGGDRASAQKQYNNDVIQRPRGLLIPCPEITIEKYIHAF